MADQIDGVTGGGNGFTLDYFNNTSVSFNVPTTGTFDVYISDTYVVSTSQPDGKWERTLTQIKNFDASSPATISFVYPGTGVDPGGVYTSSFTVTWDDPFSSYISISSINTYIEQWWDNEVKPELEAINTTLEAILEQMTPTANVDVLADQFAAIREQLTPSVLLAGESGTAPVLADQFTRIREQLTPVTDEAQTETLADQFARLRYLGDPNATEVSSDKNHGTGIRVAAPFTKLQQALLYDSLVQEGQILKNTSDEINDSSLSNFLNQRANRNNNQTVTAAESALNSLITQYESMSSTFLQYK